MKTKAVFLIFSRYKKSLKKFCFLFFLILVPGISNCQVADSCIVNDHELTIYVVRSVGSINWESPSTLYKSYIKAYLTHVFRKHMTLTGHMFVKLSTPLLEEPLYAGMNTPTQKERRILVLKEKIGLAVLGACMKAKLEQKNDLIWNIEYFSLKKEIAFITYHLNEQSARRIIDFYNGFTSKSVANSHPSDYYGGAFWPRYEYEGAGCSAFGIAMLDAIGLLDEASKSWVRNVNIPMSLIGGKFNEMQKVSSRKVKKTTCWHDGSGIEEVDFVPFSIYDPSLMYDWIMRQRALSGKFRIPGYFPVEESVIPGLSADRGDVKIGTEEPIFIQRKDSNLFIRKYYEQIQTDK